MTRAPAAIAALMALGIATAHAADASPDLVERGRRAFDHRCSMCHREGGTGTNLLARRLGKDQSLLEKRTDLQRDYVRYVVRWGLVNMPRISRVELPDPDLDGIVAYLKAHDGP